MTWNIEWALRVPEAISVLERLCTEWPFDLLMLQEMDETGTEQVARALGLDYIYATAGILHRTGRHFGNAILAPWPVSDGQVTALPHPTYVKRQARNVLGATVDVAGRPLRAYCTHAETARIVWKHRRAQFEELTSEIGSASTDEVIVGGDFNTTNARAIGTLERKLHAIGLDRVSPDGHPTFRRWGIDFTLDHLFARGFDARMAAVEHHDGASDHHPVRAELVRRTVGD